MSRLHALRIIAVILVLAGLAGAYSVGRISRGRDCARDVGQRVAHLSPGDDDGALLAETVDPPHNCNGDCLPGLPPETTIPWLIAALSDEDVVRARVAENLLAHMAQRPSVGSTWREKQNFWFGWWVRVGQFKWSEQPQTPGKVDPK